MSTYGPVATPHIVVEPLPPRVDPVAVLVGREVAPRDVAVERIGRVGRDRADARRAARRGRGGRHERVEIDEVGAFGALGGSVIAPTGDRQRPVERPRMTRDVDDLDREGDRHAGRVILGDRDARPRQPRRGRLDACLGRLPAEAHDRVGRVAVPVAATCPWRHAARPRRSADGDLAPGRARVEALQGGSAGTGPLEVVGPEADLGDVGGVADARRERDRVAEVDVRARGRRAVRPGRPRSAGLVVDRARPRPARPTR